MVEMKKQQLILQKKRQKQQKIEEIKQIYNSIQAKNISQQQKKKQFTSAISLAQMNTLVRVASYCGGFGLSTFKSIGGIISFIFSFKFIKIIAIYLFTQSSFEKAAIGIQEEKTKQQLQQQQRELEEATKQYTTYLQNKQAGQPLVRKTQFTKNPNLTGAQQIPISIMMRGELQAFKPIRMKKYVTKKIIVEGQQVQQVISNYQDFVSDRIWYMELLIPQIRLKALKFFKQSIYFDHFDENGQAQNSISGMPRRLVLDIVNILTGATVGRILGSTQQIQYLLAFLLQFLKNLMFVYATQTAVNYWTDSNLWASPSAQINNIKQRLAFLDQDVKKYESKFTSATKKIIEDFKQKRQIRRLTKQLQYKINKEIKSIKIYNFKEQEQVQNPFSMVLSKQDYSKLKLLMSIALKQESQHKEVELTSYVDETIDNMNDKFSRRLAINIINKINEYLGIGVAYKVVSRMRKYVKYRNPQMNRYQLQRYLIKIYNNKVQYEKMQIQNYLDKNYHGIGQLSASSIQIQQRPNFLYTWGSSFTVLYAPYFPIIKQLYVRYQNQYIMIVLKIDNNNNYLRKQLKIQIIYGQYQNVLGQQGNITQFIEIAKKIISYKIKYSKISLDKFRKNQQIQSITF